MADESSSSSSRRSSSSSMCLTTVVLAALLAALCLQPVTSSVNRNIIQAFSDRFTQTSGEDFYELWHTDCHRRCRAQLISHVTLACTFDPYKVTKRSLSKREVNSTVEHIIQGRSHNSSTAFIRRASISSSSSSSSDGKSVLGHRRTKRGIMNECCYSKSCSWEEYAEFCHTYNRRPANRDTRCYP
ncbi:insulin-like peptide 7 [Babylonia areolata]|uniref:insulin-like peptide 7 n=1 Tax=Babylonia areolata TaxID=304850 RepID=UPI003FD2FC73